MIGIVKSVNLFVAQLKFTNAVREMLPHVDELRALSASEDYTPKNTSPAQKAYDEAINAGINVYKKGKPWKELEDVVYAILPDDAARNVVDCIADALEAEGEIREAEWADFNFV